MEQSMMKKTICIDYGHCETAATLALSEYFLNKENIAELRPMVYDLHVNGSDLVTYTEMGLTYEQIDKLSEHLKPDYDFLTTLGDIPIGNSIPDLEGKGEIFRYFKVPPKKFNTAYKDSAYAKTNSKNLTHGAIMACYAYALIEKIFELNEDRLGDESRDSVDIIVGCPTSSDWTDDTNRSKYETLLENATGVGSVRIIPESRAAMFSSIEKKKNAVSAQDGALVLDFGSSTADCTYMLLGKAKFEFSWILGAKEIEQLIKEDVKRGLSDYKDNIEFDPYVDSETEKTFRKAKEEYYIGQRPTVYGTYKNLKTQKEEVIRVKFDDEFMTRIAKDTDISLSTTERGTLTGSWAELCNEFMRYAKDSISEIVYEYTKEDGSTATAVCSFAKVVLTGGASRMGFIEEIAKSVFPNAEVIREHNPSKTVSSGLGWVACSESRMEECIANAKNSVITDNQANIKWLIDSCQYDIYSYICAESMKIVNTWANDSSDYKTQADLQNKIDSFTSSVKLKDKTGEIIENNLAKWKSQYAECLKTSVNNETPKLFSNELAGSLIVPDDVWKKLQPNNIKISEINLGDIIKSVQIKNTIGVGFKKFFFGEDDNTRLNRPRKRKHRIKAIPTFRESLDKNSANAYAVIRKSFDKFKNEFPAIVEDAVTKAMNIAALKFFENS